VWLDSGRIGEDPSGTPNNLMPYVAQVRGVVRLWLWQPTIGLRPQCALGNLSVSMTGPAVRMTGDD
jgi:hypothetical protein